MTMSTPAYLFIAAALALIIGPILFTSSLGHLGSSALNLGTLNSALDLGMISSLDLGTSSLLEPRPPRRHRAPQQLDADSRL